MRIIARFLFKISLFVITVIVKVIVMVIGMVITAMVIIVIIDGCPFLVSTRFHSIRTLSRLRLLLIRSFS